MKSILIAAITVGAIIAITSGTISYQQSYNQKCIESGNKVTGFLQCTGMNCDFGFPANTTGISIPKKIFVSEEAQIFPKEAIVVLGTNNTVMWANHALDDFILEYNDGSQSVLISSCSSSRMIFDKPGVFEYNEKDNSRITGKIIVLEKDGTMPNILEIKEFDENQKKGESISFVVRKTGFGANYTVTTQIIDKNTNSVIDKSSFNRITHSPEEFFDHKIGFPIRMSRIAVDESGNYVLRIESDGKIIEREFNVID